MSDHSNYGRSLLLTSINQALQPKGFQLTTEELNMGEVSPSNSGVREVMVTVSIANPNGIQKNINGEQVTLVGDKTVHYDRINFRDIFNAAGHKYAVIDEVSSSAEFVQAINDRYGLSLVEGVDAGAYNLIQRSESDPHPNLTYVDVGEIVSVSAEDEIPLIDEKGRDVIGYVFWEDNVMRPWYKYVWWGSNDGGDAPSIIDDLYVFAPAGETDIRVIPIERIHEVPSDNTHYRIMFTESGPVVEYDANLSDNWGPDPEQNPYNRELFVQLARKSVEAAYEEIYNDTWFYLEQIDPVGKHFMPDRRFASGSEAQQALIWGVLAGSMPGFDEAASASGEKYLLSAGEGFQTVLLVGPEDHVAFTGCMPVRMGQPIPLVIEQGQA